jgi:uncharacterized protein
MRAALFALLVAALPALADPPSREQRVTISSKVLGTDREVLIRTPFRYGQGSDRYPVLFLTDGDAHLDHTGATVDFLAQSGRMPELIIVAIPHADRGRDLTPTHTAEFPTSGGADPFLDFIGKELVPYVDAHYRTAPYRILSGHSLGGLFAVHAFLTRTELFNAYVCASPVLQWDGREELRRARAFFAEGKGGGRTIYLALGNEPKEIRDALGEFVALLSTKAPKALSWESAIWEDEDHGSVVMRAQYFGFRKAFEGWQMPRNPAAQLVGGVREVDEHYRALSQRFGIPVAPPEGMINELGYTLLAAKKVDEAVAAFQRNVAAHPESANVYDSLGEAYEAAGRLEMAKSSYEKAYQVGVASGDPLAPAFKAHLDAILMRLVRPP